MLGTLLLIGMLVCGFLNVTPWILIPGAVVAGFLGMHYPPEKLRRQKNVVCIGKVSSDLCHYKLFFWLFFLE